MITSEQIKIIYPTAHHLDEYLPHLNEGMREFEINTANRVRAYLSQILHESQGFLYMKETSSGQEYEGRKDLGNTNTGDGVKYKGRGAIQITGRFNYRDCGLALGLDLISKPELLEKPEYAFKASAWWWKNRGLNQIADHAEDWTITIKNLKNPQGKTYSKIQWLTQRINGGQLGIDRRVELYILTMVAIK